MELGGSCGECDFKRVSQKREVREGVLALWETEAKGKDGVACGYMKGAFKSGFSEGRSFAWRCLVLR